MTGVASTLLTCLLVLTNSATGETAIAEFQPILNVRFPQTPQPFGGTMEWKSAPQLGATSAVKVSLTAYAQLTEAQVFRLVKRDVYDMLITPDSVVWDAPIDSGAQNSFEFTFTPTLVGTHVLGLARKRSAGWAQLAALALAIDEDGNTMCAGTERSCALTVVPPHPRRNTESVRLCFAQAEPGQVQQEKRHFIGDFVFRFAPSITDTVFVDFRLDCQKSLYSRVYFVLEHSTNIKTSPLPESWGDRAGPSEPYRFYDGRFTFNIIRPGLTYINFKVIGRNPAVRGAEWITTEFPAYLVFGQQGELLFIGNFDPFTRFRSKSDPMLASVSELLDAGNRNFRTKFVVSQPDYRGGSDTTNASEEH